MIDAPKLHAYVVTLSFGEGGPLHTSSWVAPDAVSATALATLSLMRQAPTEAPLSACLAIEMAPDYLRQALRAIEGKLPESGTADVLSLVHDAAAAGKAAASEVIGRFNERSGCRDPIRPQGEVAGGSEPFGPPWPSPTSSFGRRVWPEPSEPEPPGAA